MKNFFALLFFACLLIGRDCQAAGASRSDTIDIRKTIIEFNITDFITKNISARAVLDVKSQMNNVSELVFDLEGLTVDSTKVNGTITSFSHTGPFLKITLPIAMQSNDTALVEVFYKGVPIADAVWGGFAYVGNYAFQMGVGFVAQPHSFGRTWHPCFDNFVERSAYEFFITTTNDKMAVCNGLLIDSASHPNNTITWHWKLVEEIPSYLSCVGVCNYVFVKKILNGNNGNVDAWIACEVADTNKVNGSFAHLQESFTMLENNFGTYRWPRVGYTLVPFNGGAMEHATCIHVGSGFINGALTYENLLAHELSHHWWGNLVTCRSAGDMWLNEGFASYCEQLHQEFTYGKDAYQTTMRTNHFNVLSKAHISDNAYRSVANMDSLYTYGATVYQKGADVIHSMRSYLGDSVFFNTMTAFLNTYKFKDVSSYDLRDFIFSHSGVNLLDYFDNWIFAPGFTHFSIDSTEVGQNGNVWPTKVFLRQRKHKSSNYYNNVPLEVGFYDAQMVLHIYQLIFSGRCMEFHVDLPFEPKMIVVDPNSKISDAITEETRMITALSPVNLPQAKLRILPKTMLNAADSTLIRAEHSWIAPDRFKSPIAANGYSLCDTRYWKVDAVNLNNITGLIQFNYDGGVNNSYLDSAWVRNSEDSIHIFYRKDATEEWQISNDSVKAGGLFDKIGVVYVKEIKAGEYCFGIKKANYVDPLVTDAPTGGCGMVSSISNPRTGDALEMVLYPNPAQDQIHLNFFHSKPKELTIQFYSMSGLKVMESVIKTSLGQCDIQLPVLPQGIYFIKVEDKVSQKRIVKKVVIE